MNKNNPSRPILITMCFYAAAAVIGFLIYFIVEVRPFSQKKTPYQQASVIEEASTLAEAETEPVTEELTEASPAETETETETEAETESETETVQAEPIEYAFSVANLGRSRLNVREAPGTDAKIIHQIKLGTSGYVLEKGEEWSLIQCADNPNITGYVYNGYLEFTEISAEEASAEEISTEETSAVETSTNEE